MHSEALSSLCSHWHRLASARTPDALVRMSGKVYPEILAVVGNVEQEEPLPCSSGKPTPRKADGKPVLGRMAGENALWLPAGGGGERFVNADNADPVPDKLRVSEVPLQEWARALLSLSH